MAETTPAMIEADDISPDLVRGRLPKDHLIEVRDHGRLVGGFLSEQELERYRALARREVEVFVAGSLPDDIIAALEEALGEYGGDVH